MLVPPISISRAFSLLFLVALFWKKATTLSVLVAAIVSLFLSLGIFLVFPDYPFIHRMGVVFIVSGFSCYMTALLQGYQNQEKAIDIDNKKTIIECKNLNKSYSGVHALKNLSLDIKKNSVVGLIGDNGAGKSTLIKILSGAHQQDTGDLFFAVFRRVSRE